MIWGTPKPWSGSIAVVSLQPSIPQFVLVSITEAGFLVGHMLHRSCAKTWYASKADKRRIPVCPCCSAPIDERPENLKVCYFSGDHDEGSPVEPVPPQEILMALTPATKPILELLAMLHELRPRLGVADKHAYDNMVDQLMLDAVPMGKDPEPSMIREIREKLDKIVEKVTEMWAVEETRVGGLYELERFALTI